ncbi:MAG: ATP synthase subunit I [Bryobacteraceae bacterium]
MASDIDIYKRIVRRITRVVLVLGPAGAIAFGVAKGPGFGAGFLVGASLSYVSFWRWKAVVDALGGDSKKPSMWLWLLRFALLIGAGYAIVKYLEVSPLAVFLGLLVSAAAVVISVIYELIVA